MYCICFALLVSLITTYTLQAQYPYNNPVITHMYTADAAPHVMPDGRVYMVTSVDHPNGGGYSTMHSYQMFSSANMADWIDHGQVLQISDFDEPEGEDWALWAPDMVYHNGMYYLYFPIRIQTASGTRSYIGVAESDRLDKRFTVINAKIEGTNGIDPSVFIDDDGTAYLYYGSKWVAKLKDNMRELASDPVKLDIDAHNFMEAPWMHKRQSKYYFNFHTEYDGTVNKNNPDNPNRAKSQLDYSWSNSPLGPFTYGGVLNYELGVGVQNGPKLPGYDFVPWRLTQSNHGGVVEYHGQDYLFYHTSALSSYKVHQFKNSGVWTQRSVCVDEINYTPDGTVIPVQQTIESVGPITITQPFAIALKAADAQVVSGFEIDGEKLKPTASNGILKFESIDLGSGYYYFDIKVDKALANAKVQIHRDSSNGILCGTLKLNSESINNKGIATTFLREASGTSDVYLVFETNAAASGFTFSTPRFYAGSPLQHNLSARITVPEYGSVFKYDDDFTIEVTEITSGNTEAYDSVTLYANNQRVSTKTGLPFSWQKSTTDMLKKLNDGNHSLRIEAWKKGVSERDELNLSILEQDFDLYIQAEDFTGQKGIQTQSSSDALDGNTGEHVAFIQHGDWCTYTFVVPESGTYPVSFRVAVPGNNNSIQITENNQNLGNALLPNTGGFSTWRTSDPVDIFFTQGEHTLKLTFTNTSNTGFLFNFNWFKLGIDGGQTNQKHEANKIPGVRIYPNPVKTKLHLQADGNAPIDAKLYTIDGKLVTAGHSASGKLSLSLDGTIAGTYIVHSAVQNQVFTSKVIIQ